MSTYINDALRFYRAHEIDDMVDTARELAKTILTLVQTKNMLINKVGPGESQVGNTESGGSPDAIIVTEQNKDPISQVLANSLESICQLF